MLTKETIAKLTNHPNPAVSHRALTLVRLMDLVVINREQLEALVEKENK
jgi:hypothetical protein